MTGQEEQTLHGALSDRLWAVLRHLAAKVTAGISLPPQVHFETPAWLLNDLGEQFQEIGSVWLGLQPSERQASLRDKLPPAVERLARELVEELERLPRRSAAGPRARPRSFPVLGGNYPRAGSA
jgi:hypothetical protein